MAASSSTAAVLSRGADSSDAVVEMLPEQSPRRAEEFVKELSAESRKIEASVRARGGGGSAWKDCVLGSLHDGQAHAAGSRGGDGAGASSLAFVWKRELKASLLMTIVAVLRWTGVGGGRGKEKKGLVCGFKNLGPVISQCRSWW
jgi:hypothetical protein